MKNPDHWQQRISTPLARRLGRHAYCRVLPAGDTRSLKLYHMLPKSNGRADWQIAKTWEV